MKISTLTNIIPCPRCGNEPVLRRNASKLFQVRCEHCHARTGWKRKTDAVIMWYNMVIQYMRNNGTLLEQEEE